MATKKQGTKKRVQIYGYAKYVIFRYVGPAYSLIGIVVKLFLRNFSPKISFTQKKALVSLIKWCATMTWCWTIKTRYLKVSNTLQRKNTKQTGDSIPFWTNLLITNIFTEEIIRMKKWMAYLNLVIVKGNFNPNNLDYLVLLSRISEVHTKNQVALVHSLNLKSKPIQH